MPLLLVCESRTDLQVDPTFAGKSVKCVRCGGTFIAPDEDTHSADTENGISMPVLLAVLFGGHFVAWLFLAMMIGMGLSTMLVFLFVGVEVAVWQRRRLGDWLQQALENGVQGQSIEPGRERNARVVQLAPPNQTLVDDLPYWPSYYESTPGNGHDISRTSIHHYSRMSA